MRKTERERGRGKSNMRGNLREVRIGTGGASLQTQGYTHCDKKD